MTIATLLEMSASADPGRLAVGSLSFGELRARAAAMAARLRAAAAGSLAFVGVSSEDWPVTLFGCAAAGIPLTPLNYRLSAARPAGRRGRAVPAGLRRLGDHPGRRARPGSRRTSGRDAGTGAA
jgi:acyl-CoA synthetase (AMP-forming)/AMP-acid ligase II